MESTNHSLRLHDCFRWSRSPWSDRANSRSLSARARPWKFARELSLCSRRGVQLEWQPAAMPPRSATRGRNVLRRSRSQTADFAIPTPRNHGEKWGTLWTVPWASDRAHQSQTTAAADTILRVLPHYHRSTLRLCHRSGRSVERAKPLVALSCIPEFEYPRWQCPTTSQR